MKKTTTPSSSSFNSLEDKVVKLQNENLDLKTKVNACLIALREFSKRMKEMEQIYTLIDNVENFERELFDEMEKARGEVMCHYEESLRHFTDLIKVDKNESGKVCNRPLVHQIDGIEVHEQEVVPEKANQKQRQLRNWEKEVMKEQNKQVEYTDAYKEVVLGDEKPVKKVTALKEIAEESVENDEIVPRNENEKSNRSDEKQNVKKKVPKTKSTTKVVTKTKTKPTPTTTIKKKPTKSTITKRTSSRIKKKTT